MIYMDNAATTKIDPIVLNEMLPYMTELYGNASSLYSFSNSSKNAIRTSKERISNVLNTKPSNIYFTSCGSEADNWAIIGAAKASKNKRHIITSKIEHSAIINSCKELEKYGFDVTYVNVDNNGNVKIDEIINSIRDDTFLISVMFANNELGTIQPIKEIGEIARKHNIFFHTDAVQAFGHEKIDVNDMKIDLLSASGHKFNGPKGIGFLYISESCSISNYILGGEQESGRRAGTENIPGIAGIGMAAMLSYNKLEIYNKYQKMLQEYMINRILNEIPYSYLNGAYENRLANNMNFTFDFVNGESLLIMLDMKNICASTGSACHQSSKTPSHVLQAIGLTDKKIRGSIRLTISHDTTKKEASYVCDKIREAIFELRQSSPEYNDILKKM